MSCQTTKLRSFSGQSGEKVEIAAKQCHVTLEQGEPVTGQVGSAGGVQRAERRLQRGQGRSIIPGAGRGW